MELTTLAMWGVGLLALSAAGYYGWNFYNSQEPNGSQRLLSNGYTYNPPKFTNHGSLNYGCSENLFKEDPDFDNDKLYGCGLARMDLYDSGNQLKDTSGNTKIIDYLAFSSEVSMRKGDKGWKINTKFDSHHKQLAGYEHYVTTYQKDSNNGWIESDSFIIKSDMSNDNNINTTELIGDGVQGLQSTTFKIGDQELNIRIPGHDGPWYKKLGYYIIFYGDYRDGLQENLKWTKEWSGIWVEDGTEDKSWIFQDLEIFVGNKTNSLFFCKEEGTDTCWQDPRQLAKVYNKQGEEEGDDDHEAVEQDQEIRTWAQADDAYSDPETSKKIRDKVSPIIEEVKGSRGRWVDAHDFCKFGDESEISEEQFRDLHMFCAKSKA